ncbi:MAG: sensor histidine kinase, partial [Chloroflexota bacterium]
MPTTTIPDPALMAEDAEKERAQLEGEAREIDILIKQTVGEIDKLQQRQTDIASRLRQLDANLDAYSREDIKNAYLSAQDAQLRLFMMRSQLEQLQNKQRVMQRYRGQLDHISALARQLSEASSSVLLGGDAPRGVDQQSVIQIIEAQE